MKPDKPQREAIDKLHSLQEEAVRADAAPIADSEQIAAIKEQIANQTLTHAEIMAMDLETKQAVCRGYELGHSATGWKNPYPKDHPFCVLFENQVRYVVDMSRFKDALAGRQTGKDFTGEGEIGKDLHERDNSRWMIAAPSERQSLDSFDYCKTWCEAFGLYIEDYQEVREGKQPQGLLKHAEIKLNNGSRARAVPGRPETVRGWPASVFITEADFLDNPKETMRAVLPSISNPLRGGEKRMRLVSTPNGKGNLMDKTRNQPAGKMKWSHHMWSTLDAVLMGMPIDWEVLVEAFGDDMDGANQELFCLMLDASNVLLPYDLIAASESMEATEIWEAGVSLKNTAPTFLGIDFGRSDNPSVCWTLQNTGGCDWTREVLVLRKMSSPDQERELGPRIQAAQRVCFDYTGPGTGLGDYLVEKYGEYKPSADKFGKIELCTFTRPFKRELLPALRRAFESSMPSAAGNPLRARPLRIPAAIEIREDLHQMQQVISSSGEYDYVSPRTKLGHADRCIALALARRASETGAGTFGCRSVPRGPRGGSRLRAMMSGGGVPHGYHFTPGGLLIAA